MTEIIEIKAGDKIVEPGLYRMADEVYHADPVCVPSLSSSIARTMYDETARNAWKEHPRLNPRYLAREQNNFDLGSAAHDVLVGTGGDQIEELYFENFKTDAAKQARIASRAAGRIPILGHKAPEVRAMVKACRAQLSFHEDGQGFFTNGIGELVLVWTEEIGDVEIWCRAKLDWLTWNQIKHGKGNIAPDLKTTLASAGPDGWARSILWDSSYDMQDAFYARGVDKVLGIPNFELRFVVLEVAEPYLMAVHAILPAAREAASYKVASTMKFWSWCLRHNAWPGFSKQTYYNAPPPWADIQFHERKTREELAAEQELFQRLLAWNAPDAPKATP